MPSNSEKEIFYAASEIVDAGERSRFLDEACGCDAALRERLEVLLRLDGQADDFLESDPGKLADALAEVDERLGAGLRIAYFGDYELVEVIANGAMGVVYKARQTSLRRVVAVKMIRGALVASEVDVQRFRNEAEAAGRLDHPNIVPIYEVGEFEGQHYFSMKYVPGGTFADRMPALRSNPRGAVVVLEKVARAVHAAHLQGILHRDLKPTNILVGEDDEPMVSDFGLAKQMGSGSELTLSGQMMGTPYYMAPEQLVGGSRGLTTAADTYSMGAVLYEVLAGHPPFKGDTILETLKKAAEERLLPIKGVSERDLEIIARKCLDRDPAKRYASMAEFADDLGRWLRGEPIRAREASAAERLAKWARRRPAHAALAALAVLFLLTLGIGGPIVAVQQRSLREVADARADTISANLYFAEMNLAAQAYSVEGGIERVSELTKRWLPKLGKPDRRGWEWYFLAAEQERMVATLPDSSFFRQCSRSHDGKVVASYGVYPVVKLWSLDPPELLREFPVNAKRLLSGIAWNRDGTRIAVGDEDGKVHILDAETGAEVTQFDVGRLIFSVAWSPDGSEIAVGTHDHGVQRYSSAESGKLTMEDKIGQTAHSLCWSPDGEVLAGLNPGGIWRWKRDGTRLPVVRTDTIPFSLAWSPDGSEFAVSRMDGVVDVFAADGTFKKRLGGMERPLVWVDWRPDGRRIAASGRGFVVGVWNADSGKLVGRGNGHSRTIYSLAWSGDGRRIISGGQDGTVRVWDAARLERNQFRGGTVAWHPTERLLAAAENDSLFVWRPDSGTRELLEGTGAAKHLRWLSEGRELLIVAPDGRVNIRDMASGEIRTVDVDPEKTLADFDVDPGGKRMVMAMDGGAVRVRDIADGKLQLDTMRKTNGLLWATWQPGGEWLAVVSLNDVSVMDARTGVLIGESASYPEGARSVAWSPDGHTLAVGLVNTSVILREFVGGAWKERTLEGHSDSVHALAWSPDGKRLASGSAAGLVKIWDPVSLNCALTLRAHDSIVRELGWSADGKILTSRDENGVIRVWDASAGYELEK